MREIKFRVWTPKKKEMSVGMNLPMLAGWITARYPNLDDEIYLQFIGLHDKNENDIYEGDVLDIRRKRGYWVCIRHGCCFEFQSLGSYIESDGGIIEVKPFYLLHIEQKSMVIGNIYENPELLK